MLTLLLHIEGKTLTRSREGKSSNEGSAFNEVCTYLVVPLAKELESLRLLVHEDPVEVSRIDGPDLNGLITPAHNLAGSDERN